jgi:inorganic pyrophosphatase
VENLWRDLSPGAHCPRIIRVVVEIPKGSRNKYEYDEAGGYLRLDRRLFSSLHYPGDYGMVPQTLAADGDPLDVLVMVDEPTFAGCVIEARPLGVYHLVDRGLADDKILAVPEHDPLFNEYREFGDVPPHFLREMAHFFDVYKDLESAEVQGTGWDGHEAAWFEIVRAVERFKSEVLGEG